MESARKKRKFDIAYCRFAAVALITVTVWEIFDFPLPPWLITDLSLSESSFVMLQIQATIAVLPLAVIALITGISKDSLYGVPVIKYAMYLRPVLLSYRRVAIIQMLMIVASFVCTSYEWYNHLELCLFITIGNSLIMMIDCFTLLSDYQCYKEEVHSYLVENPTQENFKTLSNEIVKSKSAISSETLRDNISVLNEMLFAADTNSEIFKELNSQYINCLNTLFSSKDSDIFLCVTDALQAVYHRFNEEKHELHIFNAICFEFYNGLKYLNLTDANKHGTLDCLRFELFQNSAYNDNNELCSFTARTYQFAVIDNAYPLNSTLSKDRFVVGLYDWFSPFRDFSLLERRDRLNFFKSIVDNRNKFILDEKIYNITDIRPDSDLTDKLFVIQYLYYIAMCEPLADEEQIQFCREYINRNCNHFKQLIISCGIYHMSSDDIKLSYELMRAWEVTKINCVKTLVFDSVANDFWTFSSLVAEPSGYSLFDTLGKIAAGNEFKLYSQYFADHTTSKCTRQKYKDFCDLFGFTFDEAAISLLKSFLSEMYKQSSIQEAEREHRELIENTDFLPEQICMIKEYCEQLSNRFSDRSSEIVSDHITLFNSNEFCFELSRKGNERLQNMIKASILAAVCRTIMPNIRTSEVNFGEPV